MFCAPKMWTASCFSTSQMYRPFFLLPVRCLFSHSSPSKPVPTVCTTPMTSENKLMQAQLRRSYIRQCMMPHTPTTPTVIDVLPPLEVRTLRYSRGYHFRPTFPQETYTDDRDPRSCCVSVHLPEYAHWLVTPPQALRELWRTSGPNATPLVSVRVC